MCVDLLWIVDVGNVVVLCVEYVVVLDDCYGYVGDVFVIGELLGY